MRPAAHLSRTPRHPDRVARDTRGDRGNPETARHRFAPHAYNVADPRVSSGRPFLSAAARQLTLANRFKESDTGSYGDVQAVHSPAHWNRRDTIAAFPDKTP